MEDFAGQEDHPLFGFASVVTFVCFAEVLAFSALTWLSREARRCPKMLLLDLVVTGFADCISDFTL